MSGFVRFKDESGNEAIYRYATAGDESGDAWVSICERACKRLGLEESQEDRKRWPAVKARARERVKERQEAGK